MTIDIRRAASRTRIEQPGIVTWHSFSAGPHYDASNISFGSLIAHDEHVLAPAAGFPKHAHRGVDVVSWVLDGELRHNGRTIGVGRVLHQRTGDGVEHVEANARSDRSLRLVQMALLSTEGSASAIGTAHRPARGTEARPGTRPPAARCGALFGSPLAAPAGSTAGERSRSRVRHRGRGESRHQLDAWTSAQCRRRRPRPRRIGPVAGHRDAGRRR